MEENGQASTPWASYVQWGWWQTKAGAYDPDGNGLTDNFLALEAGEFATYIDAVAQKNDAGQYMMYDAAEGKDKYIFEDVYTFKEKYKDTDGSIKERESTVVGPKINYNPKFEGVNAAEVHWDKETELYRVGPFSINYIQSKYSGERERIFADIIGYTVRSNLGEMTLNANLDSSNQYRFYYPSGLSTADATPKPNDVFYIEFKHEDGLKEIQDISFKFKYMNAGARFQQLVGNQYKYSWKLTTTKMTDSLGITIYRRTISRDGDPVVEPIQHLTYAMVAARWYSEVELNANAKWDITNKKGDLRIVKNVVDSEGNAIIVEKDKIYKFKVTTIRANDDGEYKNTSGEYLNKTEQIVSVKVLAGHSTGSVLLPTETWSGDNAPIYRVEEIEAGTVVVDGYNYVATQLENATGKYKENENDLSSGQYNGVKVTATNIYADVIPEYEKGKLEISKEVRPNLYLSKEKVFEFDVKIKIKNNDTGKEKIIKETAQVVVAKGKKTANWISSEYCWNKENETASYEITEKENPGYTIISSSSMTGSLENNKIKLINVINNETNLRKGKIRIKKELTDEYGKTSNAKKDELFTFEVYINGKYDRDVTVKVPKNNSSNYSEFIEYEWSPYEAAPKCKIVEKRHGNYTLAYIDGEKTLVNNGTVEFEATNAAGTTGGKHGSLQIIKKVNKNVKVETKFSFEVKVDLNGDNDYKDAEEFEIVDIIIPPNKKEGVTRLYEYYWEGSNNPKYEVREINIPTNYQFEKIETTNGSIGADNVAKGKLIGNGGIVEVTATNKLKEGELNTGKIKIIKVLRDAEGNVFKADKDYIFKFEVVVRGITETAEIEIKLGQSEGIWVSNDYTWADGNAPKYKVTEIESQKFTPVLSNAVGVLDNQTVEVTAVNHVGDDKEEESAKIKLYKELIDEEGNPQSVTEKSSFYFRVYVTDNTGKEERYDEIVTVDAGHSYGEAYVNGGAEFTWKKGEKPPIFRVEEKTRVEVDNDSISGESITEKWEWKEIAIENDNNILVAGDTIVNCYNTSGDDEPGFYKGELQITKTLVDELGNEVKGKEFEFKVEVDGYPEETITIKSGDSWAKEYTWQGDTVPTYKVTENVPDGYKLVSINEKYQETAYAEKSGSKEIKNSGSGNSIKGNLKANNTVVVEVKNKFKNEGDPGVYTGGINAQKILETEDKISWPDIEDSDKTFKFKVTVYYDDPNEYFIYNGKAYNKLEIYKEKVGPGILFENPLNPADLNYPGIEVNYYGDSNNGPKYIVEEIGYPSGWQLISANNVTGKLLDGKNYKAVFTNRLPINRKYILTMELGGMVWNDTNYSNGKPSVSMHNGIREELEPGIANVIVEVYKKNNSSTPICTLLTDSNGKWQIPTIDVPKSGEEYFVKYKYDGQTYEPTIALASGTADQFINGNNTDRNKYLNDSMATENSGERNTFNNKFAQIFGNTPISDDGKTLGQATGYDLEYISRDVEYNGYSKKASELITTYQKDDPSTLNFNDEGTAKYQMTASTANLGLFYPFDQRMALVGVDKEIEKTKIIPKGEGELPEIKTYTYTYHASYPYLNNINLGLLERPHADIAVGKDLEEAIVVVNGKIYKYKYGEIANTQFAEYPDLLYKQIQINQKNIEYSLNLYKSDYYYRASIYNDLDAGAVDTDYDGMTDNNIGSMLEHYLKHTLHISDGLDSLNLDVYLTYKISVTNESDVYDVYVNQISDYVDSSLVLVTAEEKKYIDNIDGTPAGIDTDGDGNVDDYIAVVVADKPTDWEWDKHAVDNKHPANWGSLTTGIEDNTTGWRKGATEKVKYDRYISTGISAKEIKSGETVSSKLTFKVDKALDSLGTGIDNCIKLGDKYNIVEIDNYSTYYAGTDVVAGRVDEDSAPGNINISEKNSINWYEDDTDRSPVLRLGLYEEVRNINGYAWEDSENNTIEYDQVIGDGVLDYDASAGTYGEDLIPNMTTTLVEKVTVDGIDYDFIWPTDTPLGSGTIKMLTTFDSTTATGVEGSTIGKGKYEFTGIPAGDYVVRFTYGDGNTLDVSNKDSIGNIKYSGQDYKSTTYQVGTIVDNDINDDGYIDNEWHDLESALSDALADARVSDARDDESRRLEVIAKSQNMFYENTSIMDTNTSQYPMDFLNDDTDNTNTYYYDDDLASYYMEANTAKLNMNIESVLNSRKGIVDGNTYYDTIKNVGGVDVHVLNTNRKLSNGDSISVKLIKYDVNNIDFGIETRSENNVVLDKQIEQITLKTSAGDILIDAKYSIDYEYNYDSTTRTRTITPRVTLIASESIGTENLQALNRGTTPRDLGFRYLNVDKDLLQGAMITIKYRITALNTGEVDRCNSALITLGEFLEKTLIGEYQYASNFETALRNIRTEEAISHKSTEAGYKYGQYLGQIYYQGATIGISTADAVVTSKIKQVIDYVDNDVVFSQMENIDQNTSWTNTTTAELEDNRYIDNTETVVNSAGDPVTHILEESGIRKIIDSREVAYESESKNNLIVSVENDSGTTLANPILMTAIAPYNYDTNTIGNYTDDIIGHNSYVNVTVSRYYSSDMDIEEVENIAETLKLYNDVGRRDLRTIQGNTKPALGPAEAAFGENDSSATELITLSPPTGTLISTMLTLQVMAITLAAIAILAGGIYLIKRKVVIK